MKKKMKSILSFVLALFMIACIAVPAMAEGNIIIYNGTGSGQQGPQGPGPGPGPQGPGSQSGPQQGPAPQGPAPKSNSNYNYAVLKGNTGTYSYDLSTALTDYYVNVSNAFENPENEKITLKIGRVQYDTEGLSVGFYVLNGMKKAITVKRLDWLLIMKDGNVIAKVPHQLIESSPTISSGSKENVSCIIDPQYFNHNARLSGGGYTVEAEVIYD